VYSLNEFFLTTVSKINMRENLGRTDLGGGGGGGNVNETRRIFQFPSPTYATKQRSECDSPRTDKNMNRHRIENSSCYAGNDSHLERRKKTRFPIPISHPCNQTALWMRLTKNRQEYVNRHRIEKSSCCAGYDSRLERIQTSLYSNGADEPTLSRPLYILTIC
jgi:hypothetical protein